MFSRRRFHSQLLLGLAGAGLLAGSGLSAGCAGRASGASATGGGGEDWDELGFALALWRASAPEGNTALSPVNVSAALALAVLAAKGKTRRELVAALRAKNTGALLAVLGPRLASWASDAEPRINAASGLWVVEGATIEASYVREVEAQLHGIARTMALAQGPEAINAWVAEQTQGQLSELLTEPLDPLTRAMLVSALHFKGTWVEPFEVEATKPGPFTRDDGVEVEAQMMYGRMTVRTAWDEESGLYMLELPYTGDPALDMLVILPPKDTPLAEANARFDLAQISALLATLEQEEPRGTRLLLPRFTIRAHLDLIPALRSMGVARAFDGPANFSALTSESVVIRSIEHGIVIEVNEAGTEASAATAMAMAARSAPPSFFANRPFWYVIRERSGPWLFVGQLADPSAL